MRADFKFVTIVTVGNGKVTRWTEYFDTKPLKPRERTHLYPISRRSPYWEGTVQAGVSEFMVYNHTCFPLVYQHSPSEEYAALMERVTLWDVGCERQTKLRGPDALRFAQYLTTRDLSKLKIGDCKYTSFQALRRCPSGSKLGFARMRARCVLPRIAISTKSPGLTRSAFR